MPDVVNDYRFVHDFKKKVKRGVIISPYDVIDWAVDYLRTTGDGYYSFFADDGMTKNGCAYEFRFDVRYLFDDEIYYEGYRKG